MTDTELHELAKDPQAFDTRLAELHDKMAKADTARTNTLGRIHYGAGDRQEYVTRTTQAWKRTHAEVIRDAKQMADEGVRGRGNIDMGAELVRLTETETALAEIGLAISEMNRAYTGWTRFFPSVTKSQPHIHRSLSCHTLHATTIMQWAPQLSGRTDDQAVAELDEALCTVCFPSAPVALHNYQSKRSQAERDQRAADKADRDAKRAAKQLTEAEQFRTTEHPERVTTVARCKEIIRAAVEQQVTLDWYSSSQAATSWQGDADSLARVRANVAASLVNLVQDAKTAEAVLMQREAEHEGWGADAAAIAKMRASKDKSARKEWGL